MVFTTNFALIPTILSAFAGTGGVEPASRDATNYTIALTGQAEMGVTAGTGMSGDLDGSGIVRLSVSRDMRKVCYDFTLSGLATPLMAHIHRGGFTENGPTVVTLFTGPGGDLHDCLVWTPTRLAEIVASPSSFYVSLSTTEFPDGALRGQLG